MSEVIWMKLGFSPALVQAFTSTPLGVASWVAAASPDLASTILACYLSFKVPFVLNEQQTNFTWSFNLSLSFPPLITMDAKNKYSVILPTYNERRNLPVIVSLINDSFTKK